MANVKRSALVPYSAEQMFALVDDIGAYAEFLPWCRQATVHNRTTDSVEASIEIAKGALNKAFRTRNVLQASEQIEMQLIDGPFKHLHGYWRFSPLSDKACKVSLDLDYEFSNKVMSLAIAPIFNQIANTLVDSFVQRAKQHYA
ncbi:MAG: type II toxin-antitoxin system RatA family toxin [bacterium]